MDSQEGSRKPRLAAKGGNLVPVTTWSCLQCRRADRGRSQTGVLCEACAAAVAEKVQGRVWTIQESLRKLKAEASVRAKIRAWDRILAQLAALRRYEERGILPTCPPPSILLQEFQAQREALARMG